MGSRYEIKKLCESWWGKVADSARGEQQRYAEQFLRLMGWERPQPMGPATEAAHPSTRSYLLRTDGRPALAAHFVMPGALEPPGTVVERGLDFCETTRVLVTVTHAVHAQYALITDLFRHYLYDTRTEELLLWADSPGDFTRDFEDVIVRAEVGRGSLEELRRPPRSAVARHLREWCHRWRQSLVSDGHVTEETAWQAVDRLLLLRFILDQDLFKRSGVSFERRYIEILSLARSPQPCGCGARLNSLFHDLWLDWKAGIFAPDPALDSALEQDRIVAPLLREFSLHSRSKFGIPVILESFNYGEAAEKARVRMIPEEDEERRLYLARQTSATVDTARLQIDIEDEGYRAILHWFDRLVTLYERLAVEFESETFPQDDSGELDLFAWSELDAARPKALADRFQHTVEHGLEVLCASPRQSRTARLLLYLHLVQCYADTKLRFTRFPNVEAALKPRPRLTAGDRKQIFSPRADEPDVI